MESQRESGMTDDVPASSLSRRRRAQEAAARPRNAASARESQRDPHEAAEPHARGAMDGREDDISDDDRLEMFRESMLQNVLPELPTDPDFHFCWLTTTNPRDPISRRLQLGYEIVKASDFRGFDSVSLKTGDYAGCIGVNEMILARLPTRLFRRYMAEAHHNMPLQEEEKLRTRTDQIREALDARGSGIAEEGDGTQNIVQRAPAPVFRD